MEDFPSLKGYKTTDHTCEFEFLSVKSPACSWYRLPHGSLDCTLCYESSNQARDTEINFKVRHMSYQKNCSKYHQSCQAKITICQFMILQDSVLTRLLLNIKWKLMSRKAVSVKRMARWSDRILKTIPCTLLRPLCWNRDIRIGCEYLWNLSSTPSCYSRSLIGAMVTAPSTLATQLHKTSQKRLVIHLSSLMNIQNGLWFRVYWGLPKEVISDNEPFLLSSLLL
jgi:hypothetical protein